VARIQIKKAARSKVFNSKILELITCLSKFPENRAAVNILMAKILVYSAIKIKANKPLLYSTLNPDTSSDSPSAKSKGVRFVSARFVMNHRMNINGIMNIIQDFWFSEINKISRLLGISKALTRISDILTSYEIVCATPRRAPRSAYLEFEHQPPMKMAYTLVLEIHRKNRIPDVIKKDWEAWGNKIQSIKARDNLKLGATINGKMLDIVGFVCSFKKSLIASAKGTGNPNKPGLLGPFRVWK
jgi:hypothetical protein